MKERKKPSGCSPTLTKLDLAYAVAQRVGVDMYESKLLVNKFFEIMSTTLERGEQIKLTNFGTFLLHDKTERPGRNLMTGEMCSVSARRVVIFRATDALRDMIMNNVKETDG